MYRSKFVPIARALEKVGGHPALLKALRDAYVRAQGRLIVEGDERAGPPAPIDPRDWLDYEFDTKAFTLWGIETDASGASTQLRYVDIQIRRADLEKLVPKGRPPAKPGRRQHQARSPMMDELARLVCAGQPTFKNRTALGQHLIVWYNETHFPKTAPDISNVRAWLRENDGNWQVLLKA